VPGRWNEVAGIVGGAAGLLGLSLLLTAARRTSRRGSSARRSLQESRRETAAVSQDRDDLIDQRDTARANTASTLGDGAPERGPDDRPRNGLKLFGRRIAPWQAAAHQPDPVIGQPVPWAPAGGAGSPVSVPDGAPISDMSADASVSAE